MTDLFQKLRDKKAFIHLACAGAGASVIQELSSEPGASAWLNAADFLYSTESTDAFLGFKPEQYVFSTTAIYMAMEAYMKAYKWGRENPLGVGLTASIATERVHRGGQRWDIAVVTNDSLCMLNYLASDKTKGREARAADEAAIKGNILGLLHWIMDHGASTWKWRLDDFQIRETVLNFLACKGKEMEPCAIYPGAFNPPHKAHYQLANMAREKTGADVAYHINIDHPIKGTLTGQQILQRKKLLAGEKLLLSRDLPLYLDLARAYPGSPIVIGTDALQRMLDPKWGPNVYEMVQEFCQLGTVFYVGERIVNGQVLTADEVLRKWNNTSVQMNNRWIQVVGVTGSESSTEIRNEVDRAS